MIIFDNDVVSGPALVRAVKQLWAGWSGFPCQIIQRTIIRAAPGKLFNPPRTFLYFILKMWMWQKYVLLLHNLLFAGCGLFLIFVYLRTQDGEIWFQNVEVSRGLVLASGILSIMLCIPCLVLFTFFQSIDGIRKNPRGSLVIQFFYISLNLLCNFISLIKSNQ